MKRSEFFGLLMVIIMAPHMPFWGALFMAFIWFCLMCIYTSKGD